MGRVIDWLRSWRAVSPGSLTATDVIAHEPTVSSARTRQPSIPWRPAGATELMRPEFFRVAVTQKVLRATRAHVERNGALGFLFGRLEPLIGGVGERTIIDGCWAVDGLDLHTGFGGRFGRSWHRARVEAERRGRVLVGWYHRHGLLGPTLSSHGVKIHRRFFPHDWQVALVLVPSPTPSGGVIQNPRSRYLEADPVPFLELLDDELAKPGVLTTCIDWQNYINDLSAAGTIAALVDPGLRSRQVARAWTASPAPPPSLDDGLADLSILVDPSLPEDLIELEPVTATFTFIGDSEPVPVEPREPLDDSDDVVTYVEAVAPPLGVEPLPATTRPVIPSLRQPVAPPRVHVERQPETHLEWEDRQSPATPPELPEPDAAPVRPERVVAAAPAQPAAPARTVEPAPAAETTPLPESKPTQKPMPARELMAALEAAAPPPQPVEPTPARDSAPAAASAGGARPAKTAEPALSGFYLHRDLDPELQEERAFIDDVVRDRLARGLDELMTGSPVKESDTEENLPASASEAVADRTAEPVASIPVDLPPATEPELQPSHEVSDEDPKSPPAAQVEPEETIEVAPAVSERPEEADAGAPQADATDPVDQVATVEVEAEAETAQAAEEPIEAVAGVKDVGAEITDVDATPAAAIEAANVETTPDAAFEDVLLEPLPDLEDDVAVAEPPPDFEENIAVVETSPRPVADPATGAAAEEPAYPTDADQEDAELAAAAFEDALPEGASPFQQALAKGTSPFQEAIAQGLRDLEDKPGPALTPSTGVDDDLIPLMATMSQIVEAVEPPAEDELDGAEALSAIRKPPMDEDAAEAHADDPWVSAVQGVESWVGEVMAETRSGLLFDGQSGHRSPVNGKTTSHAAGSDLHGSPAAATPHEHTATDTPSNAENGSMMSNGNRGMTPQVYTPPNGPVDQWRGLTPRDFRGEPPGSGPVDLLAYWRIIRERRATVLAVFSIVFLGVMIGTFLQKPVYRATGTLEIRKQGGEVVPVEAVLQPARLSTEYLETQYGILESRTLMRRVVRQLGLDQSDEGQASESTLEQAVNRFGSDLGIDPVRGSRLVNVNYEDGDPELAARAVNSVIGTYIAMRVESGEQAGERLARQVDSVRTELAKSEAELQTYMRENGLLFVPGDQGDGDIAGARLTQLQAQITEAEAERYEKESRYQLVQRGEFGLLDSNVLQTLSVRIADLRADYARLRATFKDEYPRTRQVKGQLDELEALYATERNRIAAEIRNDYQAAVQRQELLTGAFEEQQALVDRLAAATSEYRILKRDVDAHQDLYSVLQQHRREAGVSAALAANDIAIVDLAVPPLNPFKPTPKRNAMLGLIMGLVLGIAGAFLRELTDRSVRTVEEVGSLVDVPVLAAIPSATSSASTGLIPTGALSRLGALPKEALEEPPPAWHRIDQEGARQTALSEAFGGLRTSVMVSGTGDPPRSMLITSTQPREGKTTITVNLAISLARLGRRVLIIDADTRCPAIHKVLGLDEGPGLTGVLDGLVDWRSTVQRNVVQGLDVLTAGPPPEFPSELLSSVRAVRLLRAAESEYDFVLIDSPALLVNVPDTRILAPLVDGVLLVLRSGVTPRSSAQRVLREIPNPIGVVLNDLRRDYLPGYYRLPMEREPAV